MNQLKFQPTTMIFYKSYYFRCKFGAQGKKYRPKGKSTKIQESFDVPSYVLHHVMMGQNWPEGEYHSVEIS